jgi:Bacteriophage baseplate protein W
MSALAQLGRGWSFPVRVDAELRRLLFAAGPEKVRESIWIILDTEPGERIMRPTFGCGLRRYLGEPNTVAVRALIRHDVEQALALWEPRINVSSVDVTPGDDPSLVEIAIAYVHVRTTRPDNLVYPLSLV